MKNIRKTVSLYREYFLVFCVALLMLVQRFLTGGYKPVMDDWFLYGDLYKGIGNRLSHFAIANEKFAIRPLAGLADCFINAPLFGRLWVVELVLTFSLLVGAFLIIRTLRRNNASGMGFFMCMVCLFPLGLEATYWIAASTRISYAVLFMGIAVLSLDVFFKSHKKGYFVSYCIFGMICVCFYEPAIVMYILLVLLTVTVNRKEKKDLIPLLVLALQIIAIGFYYVANSGSGELEMRGSFLSTDIAEHTKTVTDYIKTIFTEFSYTVTKHGYAKGSLIVFGHHKFVKTITVALLSFCFGVLSALCIKKRKFSPVMLIFGVVLFLGGLSLNYVLGSDRIPLRLVFFSFLGIGLIADEMISLLPKNVGRIVCCISLTAVTFVFTVSGIGEVNEYQTTSDIDTNITSSLISLATTERITDVDKNTYLFGGQHYYADNNCINYLEHIRGVSGNYADITGCMRHLTDTCETNNILTFTYGDIHKLKPFIDVDGLCEFYNIEYDKTVVPVTLVADGDDYLLMRSDNSVAGELINLGDGKYQYFN